MADRTSTAAGEAPRLVALAASRRPTGRTRVVGVEGRSGSGKTTFADIVAQAVVDTGADRPPVLHLDDLYPGWDGLHAAPALLAAALAPLAAGRPGRYARWDWRAGRPGEDAVVAPSPWLVVEGVGCGAAPVRPLLTALAWLDAPDATRKRRAVDRDGDTYLPHWDQWAAQESALLTRDDIRAAADLVVTTG